MEWEERAFFSISFCIWRDAGGYPVKRRYAKLNVMVSSPGIRSSSCTPRGWSSREIRVSITLIGVIGVGRVAPRFGGAAERVHVATASPMALTPRTVHVTIRESIVAEKAGWWRVRNMRRNRKPALGRG